MSDRVRLVRNDMVFLSKNEQLKDMALAHMAQDIEIRIKTGGRTPVKTGGMKADVRHSKSGNGKYKVQALKEYSAVQELGRRAGAAAFNRYTTSGTGGGWFKEAVDTVVRKKDNYVKQAARALNI